MGAPIIFGVSIMKRILFSTRVYFVRMRAYDFVLSVYRITVLVFILNDRSSNCLLL
jgi:hypothetical protein